MFKSLVRCSELFFVRVYVKKGLCTNNTTTTTVAAAAAAVGLTQAPSAMMFATNKRVTGAVYKLLLPSPPPLVVVHMCNAWIEYNNTEERLINAIHIYTSPIMKSKDHSRLASSHLLYLIGVSIHGFFPQVRFPFSDLHVIDKCNVVAKIWIKKYVIPFFPNGVSILRNTIQREKRIHMPPHTQCLPL